MGSKLPFFKFWALDWKADQKISLLSQENRGVFLTLLIECWIEGSIPSDPEAIRLLCFGISRKRWNKVVWPEVKKFFIPISNLHMRLTNQRLEEVRLEAQAASDHGKKAISRRWNGHTRVLPE